MVRTLAHSRNGSVKMHNWESDVSGRDLGTPFVDILHPLLVFIQTVGRDTNNLHVTLCKVRSSGNDVMNVPSAAQRQDIRTDGQLQQVQLCKLG